MNLIVRAVLAASDFVRFGKGGLSMSFRASIAGLVLCVVSLESAVHASTIGGFNLSRSDVFSVPEGDHFTSWRSDISAVFPGTTFTAAPTLTPAYLETIDVLIINSGGVQGGFFVTSPLSPAEQAAVLGFVQAGRSAIIMVDNDTFGGGGANTSAVNQSFVEPFGISVTGTVRDVVTDDIIVATATNATHPIIAGPFGSVSTFRTNAPGWFDSLGANADELARLSTENVALAVINRGDLGIGTGAVTFTSDFNMFDTNRLSMEGNTVLARNMLAYAIPEPSTISLLVIAVLCSGIVFLRRHTLMI